jgi:hypothetical protein
MLFNEELPVLGFGQHGTKELEGHLVLQQPGFILGKGRRVDGWA